MSFTNYTGKLPGKNLFQKTLSGNLLPRKSSSHLLTRCFPDDLFQDLKNNLSEELFEECLRNVSLKVMIKIYGRNTAGGNSPLGIFQTPTVLVSSDAILLTYITQNIWVFNFQHFDRGPFSRGLLSGALFPGSIFLDTIVTTILLIPKFQNKAVLNSKE